MRRVKWPGQRRRCSLSAWPTPVLLAVPVRRQRLSQGGEGGQAASALAKTSTGAAFWTSAAEFGGKKVFQRTDLKDPKLVDKMGRTNVQRMKQGLHPIGPDGNSVNLHHLLQSNDSPIAEIAQTFHRLNGKIIHINPNTIPSGIDRPAFDASRARYWVNRAKDFGG